MTYVCFSLCAFNYGFWGNSKFEHQYNLYHIRSCDEKVAHLFLGFGATVSLNINIICIISGHMMKRWRIYCWLSRQIARVVSLTGYWICLVIAITFYEGFWRGMHSISEVAVRGRGKMIDIWKSASCDVPPLFFITLFLSFLHVVCIK